MFTLINQNLIYMKTILPAIILFSSVALISCSQNTGKEESDVKTACTCKNCDGNCEKNGCSANCGHK